MLVDKFLMDLISELKMYKLTAAYFYFKQHCFVIVSINVFISKFSTQVLTLYTHSFWKKQK